MEISKQFKVLEDLYVYISQDEKLSSEQKKNYLSFLKSQNPIYKKAFSGVSFLVSKKEINLKSFFEGREGVNIIANEGGNFEKYVLPKLPDVYTVPDEYRECFISGYKFEVTLITSSIFCRSRLFSMNEALAIIADRILITDRESHGFLSPDKSVKLDKSGKDNVIYFDDAGSCRKLEVTFNKEKKAWKVALMLPSGD